MIFFPAIDLKDGQCVRLVHGDMEQVTVFNDDAGAQAAAFAEQGCEWLHVVDLNGAFEGKPVNADPVRSILDAVDIPVQLGGGIRDLDTIEYWLDAGIRRVILGTVALRDPELVKTACRKFPDRVAVGIDARDGFVAVEGWAEVSEMTAVDLADKFEDAGVAAIIYTDIHRDGAMQGVNVEATAELAEATSIPVIASGGVSSVEDLKALKLKASSGIAGAISGRALYDGGMDLAEAIAVCAA